MVSPIGVKLCTMADIFPTGLFFGGDIFRGVQIGVKKGAFGWTIFVLSDTNFLPPDREYLENGKSQRYMGIRT